MIGLVNSNIYYNMDTYTIFHEQPISANVILLGFVSAEMLDNIPVAIFNIEHAHNDVF